MGTRPEDAGASAAVATASSEEATDDASLRRLAAALREHLRERGDAAGDAGGAVPLLDFELPDEWLAPDREVAFWRGARASECFELEMCMAAAVLRRLLVQKENGYLCPQRSVFFEWPSRDRHQLWATLWLALRLLPGRSYSKEELDRLLAEHLVEANDASLLFSMFADLERRNLIEPDGAGHFKLARSQVEFVLDGDKLFLVRNAVVSCRPWWALPLSAQFLAAPAPRERPPVARRFRCVFLAAGADGANASTSSSSRDAAPGSVAAAPGVVAAPPGTAKFVSLEDVAVRATRECVVEEGDHRFAAIECEFAGETRCLETYVAVHVGSAARIPPFRVDAWSDEAWQLLQCQPMPTGEEMCDQGRGAVRCFLPHAVPVVEPLPDALEQCFGDLVVPEAGSIRLKRWPAKQKQQANAALWWIGS
eukprot:TRINITY_DN20891_c0_g2_i2.p1 TRINITY_DN20891_c0_g2~~TRINITY_DN20891_c0_g2_i2.p1  ORF type:complete len:423 (-),score=102.52 TRINITY_DN20891_c0_g2_i2:301-1569(-)